jgi:hypothetical protein
MPSCSICINFYFELALASGTAMPIMMWLFKSVINGLVDTANENTTSTNW